MNVFYVILIIVILWAIWFIFTRNNLVKKKNYITETWFSIDVQLKRKTNVLTNLIDAIKLQTDCESETLEKIVKLKAQLVSGGKDEAMEASNQISKLIPSIIELSERYHELKSNKSYLHLMEDIKIVEDKIIYATTRYNMAITDFNTAIQSFPTSIVAGMLRYSKEKTY